jgi:hypothetical protein
MSDPWAFGWTQLLTIVGMMLTLGIAATGFRTFDRWKKEKLEEKRIETAIDALSMVYESKFIFDHIRSGFVFEGEAKELPTRVGESDALWRARGRYFAILKRIEANREFFERAWKLQVRCAAIFGPKVEDTFLLLQRARREVEVSAGMLLDDPEPQVASEDNKRTWRELHDNVWAPQAKLPGHSDNIGKMLNDFREQVERLCRPIVDHQFKLSR